jgi:hypothetical protein
MPFSDMPDEIKLTIANNSDPSAARNLSRLSRFWHATLPSIQHIAKIQHALPEPLINEFLASTPLVGKKSIQRDWSCPGFADTCFFEEPRLTSSLN